MILLLVVITLMAFDKLFDLAAIVDTVELGETPLWEDAPSPSAWRAWA